MENVFNVDDFGKVGGLIKKNDVQIANSFLRDINSVLNTVKDITGLNIADEIKKFREQNLKNSEEIPTENPMLKTNNPESPVMPPVRVIETKPEINIPLAKQDLLNRIKGLQEKEPEKTIKQFYEELVELDKLGVIDGVVREWFKGVVK